MTKLIVRLILCSMLLPLAVALFIVMMLVASLIGGTPDSDVLLFIWVVEFLFIGTYWYLLWKPLVNWTPTRIRGSVMAIMLSLLSGLAFGAILHVLIGDREITIGMSGIAPPLTFLLATLAVWKETEQERSDRLQLQEGRAIECPGCGHDMRGLKSTTCPECGLTLHLQELLYSQPGIDSHEIETHEHEA